MKVLKQNTMLCKYLIILSFLSIVWASRSQTNSGNSIHHGNGHNHKQYVRSFTKYHHRRTIQWNTWPVHHSKISKRSVPNFDLLDADLLDSNYLESQPSASNTGTEKTIKKNENTVNKKLKKNPSSVNTVSTISCLYKINSVALRATPAYDDDKNSQQFADIEDFDTPGPLSETTLDTGEVVQIEQCTDVKASCYTLWHQDAAGNVSVLGQGCWRSSQHSGAYSCGMCTRVTPKLPSTRFCCCATDKCNKDYSTLEDYVPTPTAESTVDNLPNQTNYSHIVASVILAKVALLVLGVVLKKLYCNNINSKKEGLDDGLDVEKDLLSSSPDALATGLLCVDNLTLVEHIGEGRFGSVWRGRLGASSVAVKLYSGAATWERETAIYKLPFMQHRNLLRYYGSDSRPVLTESGQGRSRLLVLELCSCTLRERIGRDTLSWRQFADIAHGMASALAHLHSVGLNKPCVVHRDVNSSNVLIAADGTPRLADLGLAQVVHPRSDRANTRITEAGTLRYLAPEALEGALDLSGARAALCAVDVFALALVLWEALWRTRGAHAQHTPDYAQPYHHHGVQTPTLAQMQSVVSRNKWRPPLPRGPSSEPRALQLAAATCDECWDHDAEARLTAVCVEERMAELKAMLTVRAPLIHDNNLHDSHQPNPDTTPTQEVDKNSNCLSQYCDVPLYAQPHIGRNACIERNTNTHTTTVELIHKSLKDITVTNADSPRLQNVDNNCLSMARIGSSNRIQTYNEYENSERFNEIRSYQRPLDYVQNDVSSHDVEKALKETNLHQEAKRPKWGLKRFFQRIKSSNPLETEVKLVPDTVRIKTSIVEKENNRPCNLILDQSYNFEAPCTLSPPNRTLSPTMMELNNPEKFAYKELPQEQQAIFAVIVPKVATNEYKSKSSSDSLKMSLQSISTQSLYKAHSESDDSTIKKRLSDKISTSARSSKASINLELQYIDRTYDYINTDSSSEDEQLLLLSENGSKITMHSVKDGYNEVLKESLQPKPTILNKYNTKYSNFDNEISDQNDKENLLNSYSGDNPVYIAEWNEQKKINDIPKQIARQRSLEEVSEIFSSAGDLNLQNPAGRVKTPGDIPMAVRRARRDRALQKGRATESNRLSLYDDRMMFGNTL